VRASRATLVVAALLLVLLTTLAGAGRAAASPGDDAAEAPDTPLILAGVSGLQWSDVDATRTPHLWRLIGGGSVASIAVRTLTPTCPLDAWLSISGGSKVTAQNEEDVADAGEAPGKDEDAGSAAQE